MNFIGKKVSVFLKPEDIEYIDALAECSNMSRSAVIRMIVESYTRSKSEAVLDKWRQNNNVK